ncbi:MAG: hypothetical protein HYX28_00305 [Candidatus Koribacter versatilis]|uniref:Uncharacterized protein n=1 Tax=Candidatus Korobacter versatilis TaxID=658062 RepID=A0A932EP59_9BACT|nr:hypothetical protein [Candidatus Koribacter versatilis]
MDNEPAAHSEKWVEAAPSAANPAASTPATSSDPSRALVDSLAARRGDREDTREERRGRREVSSSSSQSFLGLGSADYEPPQREISWRFWALMLVLLGVVALFGLQWRSNRLRAEQNKPQPAQTQPADQTSTGDQTNPAGPASGEAQPNDSGAPASTADAQQNRTTTDTTGTKDKSAPPAADEPKTPKTPKGAQPKPEASATPEGEASPQGDGDKPIDDAAEPKTTTSLREASDAPVRQAESLIASGDCNGAVRVLRNAGSNPRALTKLGAMYLTGTCVGTDRVTAYTWFSQAFNADPHNLRLESTRRMVWRQMSDDERAKVEQGVGGR